MWLSEKEEMWLNEKEEMWLSEKEEMWLFFAINNKQYIVFQPKNVITLSPPPHPYFLFNLKTFL